MEYHRYTAKRDTTYWKGYYQYTINKNDSFEFESKLEDGTTAMGMTSVQR